MDIHFKNYKPSLSDLDYDAKRAIHIAIRANRLVHKITSGSRGRTAVTPEQKRAKKFNELIPEMSVSDMDKMLEEIKMKKERLRQQ